MTERTLAEMETAPLTRQDRCEARGVSDERCGARARVRVHFQSGMLDFCGRHYEDNKLAITADAIAVQDESERIQEEEDRKEGIIKPGK